MTREFLEKCVELRGEYIRVFKEECEKGNNIDGNENISNAFFEYRSVIMQEVNGDDYSYDIIDGIVKYSYSKGIALDYVINALREIGFEVE